MANWISTNWDKIDDAVTDVIAFIGSILKKFATWPLFDVTI